MSKKDYYTTLGVSRSASSAEIKKAYLKLAKKYHPDANKGDAESEKKFKDISAAYDVLKDEQKKAAYDTYGHDAFNQGHGASGHRSSGFHGADINDIFGDFFGDFMGGRRRSRSRDSSKFKGSDLRYNIEITLEEAFTGVDKEINFTAETTCKTCNGSGTKESGETISCFKCSGLGTVMSQQGFFTVEQPCDKCHGEGEIIKDPCNSCNSTGRTSQNRTLIVNIPAGVENENRIRITGEGEAGIRGNKAGDLQVFVSVKNHDTYMVENGNLHCKLPLNFTKAALGGEVEIPTIEGGKLTLKIPAGIETGEKLRLRGKGMSKLRSSERGNLYAHAYVETPKKLTPKQKELLEELDKEFSNKNSDYKDNGFFSKMKNIWT